MISRRDFLKFSGVSAAALYAAAAHGNPLLRALAAPAAAGLSDPAAQPKFAYPVPDALAPEFIFQPDRRGRGGNDIRYKIQVGTAVQQTGLKANGTGPLLNTPVWGYGAEEDQIFTWPGRTFQVKNESAGGPPEIKVRWQNKLNEVKEHLLPVDTSLHWCYILPGY